VKGSKRSWILDWPHVPDIWPILSSTNLIHQEILLLQDAGFKLQERLSMLPRHMFMLSNLLEALVFDHLGQPNPDIHPTTRNSKSIWRNVNAPTAEHRNKWESARNIKGMVLGITILPFPGLGAIISLESGVEPDKKVYRITISHFLSALVLISSTWLWRRLENGHRMSIVSTSTTSFVTFAR
jgi:hypothetical protein